MKGKNKIIFSRLSFEATLYPIFFFFLSSQDVFFNVKFYNFFGSQLVQTCPNSPHLAPTCPNLLQLAPFNFKNSVIY